MASTCILDQVLAILLVPDSYGDRLLELDRDVHGYGDPHKHHGGIVQLLPPHNTKSLFIIGYALLQKKEIREFLCKMLDTHLGGEM